MDLYFLLLKTPTGVIMKISGEVRLEERKTPTIKGLYEVLMDWVQLCTQKII